MEARETEMTADEMKAAYEAKLAKPRIDKLVRRFNTAFQATNGDTDTAMAVVNEVLDRTVTYEAFLAHLKKAA